LQLAQREINSIISTELPFEAFIETLQNKTDVDSIIEIFNSTYVNSNHLLLANLAKKRFLRTIYTTNFDQLIELAPKSLGLKIERDYMVFYKEEEFDSIDWNVDIIRIIKLHGSLEDKNGMAITLKQIATHNLSSGRQNIINRIFSTGPHKNVLIIGYSCSDVFDISIHIDNIKSNFKKIYFIEHLNLGNQDNQRYSIESLDLKAKKNPFKKFNDSIRFYYNTDELTKKVWQFCLDKEYRLEKTKLKNAWKKNIDTWAIINLKKHNSRRLSIVGDIFFQISEPRLAMKYYQRALARLVKKDDIDIKLLSDLANTFQMLGHMKRSREFIDAAFSLSNELANERCKMECFDRAGFYYQEISQYHNSISNFFSAFRISLKLKDNQLLAQYLGSIGNNYGYLGNQKRALKYYYAALENAQSVGEKERKDLYWQI
jgi:tetratricopeptide (TPR) repeat protein